VAKQLKVGIFLVGGIILFCVGLFLIGSSEQLFGSHFTVYTDFNDIQTLQTGAKVRVSGMDAGEVTGIAVPKQPSGEFRLKLKVDQKFHSIVRQDSVATIETEGMVGNKFVNIAKGTDDSPECKAGCTLRGEEPVSIGALMRQGGKLAQTMQSTIEDVHKRADTAIQNIANVAGHADGMIVAVRPNVEKIASNSASLTGNANAVVADIRHGHGAAGKLLTDRAVGSDVQATVANAKQTTANLQQASKKVNAIVSQVQQTDMAAAQRTLQNAQDMTQQLNQAVGTFLSPGGYNENTAAALRGAAHGAQQTMSNLADDTEAIKHNFFFRGFFHRRGYFDMETITPSKYEESEFVKKPRARVWIPAAGLFAVNAQGAQELTGTGQEILNQYMSDLVRYLPNNPIVVEGYATAGLPAQRYLASRQRALAVRNYLISHFHLNAARVGAIPLADHPPKGTGKAIWDGICLSLVVSK
jgi:phospholipid/cholesterol/gamma-HCH transport system substrate-binding protein